MSAAFFDLESPLLYYENIFRVYCAVLTASSVTAQKLHKLNFSNVEEMYAYFNYAPTYDKLPTKEERAEKYRAVFADGAAVLESDLPIEVNEAIK